MKKRLIINLILLIVLLTLVGLVWLKPGQETAKQQRLVNLEIKAINSIRIERSPADIIELKKHRQHWVLTSPIEANALAGKVERLLKISQIEPPTSYPLDHSSMQRFGLQPPVARMSFNNKEVLIGKTENVNARRYVSTGNQLFLLDDTFLHHLTAPVSSYIDNRLLPDDVQITALKTPSIQLQQTKDHSWRNSLKPKQALSADAVQILFDEWRFARAISVNATMNEEQGESITLQFNNQPSLHFTLIKKTDTVLLINNDKQLAYSFSPKKYQQMTTLK